MHLRLRGYPTARLTGITCLFALGLSGCGTTAPNSATEGSPGGAASQGAAISAGPQLGLVWDASDATLRPLAGVPGATWLGAPLFPAGTWTAGAFAVATQTALLIDPHGNLQMLALPSLQPETIAANISPGAAIRFAPEGGWAVVYVPGAASALLVGGLPGSVTASVTHAGAAIRGAAVSDAGTLLLATDAAGGGVAVSSISAAGSRSGAGSLEGFGGMSFVPGSDNFVLADSAADTLTLWRSGAAAVLATGANHLNAPFAVAVSRDGRWAIAADRADSNLLRVDLTGATAPLLSPCACSLTQLTPLAGNAVFALNSPGTAPGWMIEADDIAPRILFIPAARSGQ